ncbi:MAG: ABC transporter permease [Firmicutes bacterium]|nr:ABC transporter permease [Bacillota bacterium]
MSFLFKMAWRNIFRQRSRTLLSLLAIAAGVVAVIFSKAWIDGMMASLEGYTIDLTSGHVRLIRPEYRVKERLLSLAYPLGEEGPGYARLVEDLRHLPGVAAATGRIRFGLLLAPLAGEKQLALQGVGAELAAEDRVAHLGRFLRGEGEGRLPLPGRQEILLGKTTLRKLGLKVGDKVNAVFNTSFGSFKIATFRIVGAIASGLMYLDESTAYIPLDVAMNLLELPDAVTEIVVFADRMEKTRELQQTVEAYLRQKGLSYTAIPWTEHNELIAYMEKIKGFYSLIYFAFMVLASFVVFNTMMMIVSERTQEIGMLAALGFAPGGLRRLFLAESLLVACGGSILGVLFGGAVNWILAKVGFDLSAYMETSAPAMMLPPRIYPSFRWADLFFAALLGVVVTVFAAYLPARRAARLHPTEALRTI